MSLKKFWIETYGCQMNKAESESIKILLLNNNWIEADHQEEADLVILNTCSVRKTAENRIWGRLGYFKHEKGKRDFKLAVIGCMTERLKEKFIHKSPEVDILVGNFQKHDFLDIVEDVFGNSRPHHNVNGSGYTFSDFHNTDKFKAFVPIMHGCNNYCTYCIVPYLRGPEISREPDRVINEIQKLEKSGIREITLLGQNVNSYFFRSNGNSCSFSGLIKQILEKTKTPEWIRFLTSHPKDIDDELIRIIAGEGRMCRHIHLPVQHGSDKILAAMGRKYTRAGYLSLVEKIKKIIPDVSLTTDILIGFPGETDADFRDTIDLLDHVRFEEAFTYRYNPREGTKAYQMEDSVSDTMKQQRLSCIIDRQRTITHEAKMAQLGRTVKILIEDRSKKNPEELLGRTERNEMVVFESQKSQIGDMINVQITRLKGNTFIGKEIVT